MQNENKGNSGENFVNDLAYKSFLKYWCYPNPKNENGDKKEISDLLIIFKDVCIIFSVKNYEFKGNHERYFNNTIEKATRQLNGAQKTLFKSGTVNIKHPERQEETFPKESINKIYKVIVNLGEGLGFYELSKNSKYGDLITIFDKDTFSVIINELDTIPDFIDYIDKRCLLFKNKDVKAIQYESLNNLKDNDYKYLSKIENDFVYINGTEKDLLSYFFKNTRNFPEILNDNTNGIILDIKYSWENYKQSSKTIKKDKADKVSYFVDNFVKNEVLKFDYELKEDLAKELLSLNRLNRRTVGKKFFDFYFEIEKYQTRILNRKFIEINDLAIVFFNYFDDSTIQEIEILFNIIFETFAYYYKYRHKTFILIGINKNPHFTYHIFKDFERFSSTDEEIIRQNIKELGWFTDYNEYNQTEYEFPE